MKGCSLRGLAFLVDGPGGEPALALLPVGDVGGQHGLNAVGYDAVDVLVAAGEATAW